MLSWEEILDQKHKRQINKGLLSHRPFESFKGCCLGWGPPTEKDSQLRQLSLMAENHNNLLEKILRWTILRKLIEDIRYHQMDLLPLIIAMWWVQHSPIRIEKKLHCRDLIGRHIKCEIRITIMIQFQGRLLVMIQICGHTVRILI